VQIRCGIKKALHKACTAWPRLLTCEGEKDACVISPVAISSLFTYLALPMISNNASACVANCMGELQSYTSHITQ
jgi:hypothetical protein